MSAGVATVPDLVESYAEQAVERWQRQGFEERRGMKTGHTPSHCDCLVCADGRALTGAIPLKPRYARRRLP